MRTIYHDIVDERERQEEKWGTQRNHWGTWMAILGEEYGEVCQEALNETFDQRSGYHLDNLRTELVQVAAVAVAIIEHIDDIKDHQHPLPCTECEKADHHY